MPNQLLGANADVIAYQMEEYKNSDLVKIFSLFEHFSIQELRGIFTILCYCLGRENHKINAVCFPPFHNGCNSACKVWRRLWTGEWIPIKKKIQAKFPNKYKKNIVTMHPPTLLLLASIAFLYLIQIIFNAVLSFVNSVSSYGKSWAF